MPRCGNWKSRLHLGCKDLRVRISFGVQIDNEILDGLHPSYSGCKLRVRLFAAGLKEEKCEDCGVTEWRGKKLILELDHIDGDRTNHKFENLRILCPNCHSQTETFSRVKKLMKEKNNE